MKQIHQKVYLRQEKVTGTGKRLADVGMMIASTDTSQAMPEHLLGAPLCLSIHSANASSSVKPYFLPYPASQGSCPNLPYLYLEGQLLYSTC
jgi:hypothetical protein